MSGLYHDIQGGEQHHYPIRDGIKQLPIAPRARAGYGQVRGHNHTLYALIRDVNPGAVSAHSTLILMGSDHDVRHPDYAASGDHMATTPHFSLGPEPLLQRFKRT